MEGTIVERRDSEGIIRRKGEMVLPGNGKLYFIIHIDNNIIIHIIFSQ